MHDASEDLLKLVLNVYLNEAYCLLHSLKVPSNGIHGADSDDTAMDGIRPYLNHHQRESVNYLSDDYMKYFLEDQLCLHIPFTSGEKDLISTLFHDVDTKEKIEALKLDKLLNFFKGRSEQDLQNYLKDKLYQSEGDYALYWKETSATQKPPPNKRKRKMASSNRIFEYLSMGQQLGISRISLANQIRPAAYFSHLKDSHLSSRSQTIYKKLGDLNVCSGSVSCIKSFEWNSKSHFVISACANTEEVYNRVGELIVATTDQLKVKLLNAHFTKSASGQTLRATVTHLQTSEENGVFFSCSYGKFIKVWSMEYFNLLSTWKEHKDVVNMMAVHPNHKLLASASQDGTVLLWPFRPETSYHSKAELLFKKPVKKEYFSNGYPDWLCSVTGLERGPAKKGVVDVWDVVQNKKLGVLNEASGGLSCISLNPNGDTVAVAGGMVTDYATGDGILRLYDLRALDGSGSSSPIFRFNTNHADVDSIFFSPDPSGFLVGSCDFTTNEILVIDQRFGRSPLHRLIHEGGDIHILHCVDDSCIADTPGYVASIWTQQDHLLITGAADQAIKIWDLSLSSPLLYTITGHDSSITSMALSSDDTTLTVGCDSGTVYIYTMNQLLHARFPDGKFNIQRMS